MINPPGLEFLDHVVGSGRTNESTPPNTQVGPASSWDHRDTHDNGPRKESFVFPDGLGAARIHCELSMQMEKRAPIDLLRAVFFPRACGLRHVSARDHPRLQPGF